MPTKLEHTISHNFDSIEFIVETSLTLLSRHEVKNVSVFRGFNVTYRQDIIEIFFVLQPLNKKINICGIKYSI